MKIEQLTFFCLLLVSINLSGQQWIYHEIETGPAGSIVHDCDGNVLFARGTTLVKHSDGVWTESEIETNDSECDRLNLVKDPYGCDIVAMGFFGSCNILARIDGEQAEALDILPYGNCFAVAYGPGSRLYASCDGDLIEINSEGEVRPIDVTGGPVNTMRLGIAHDNEFWIQGTDASFDWDLYSYDQNNWTLHPDKDAYRYFSHKDSEGNSWFSQRDELYKYDGTNWSFEKILPYVNNITDIEVDRDENMWIATNFNGIYYWDQETLTIYNEDNSGLKNNNCFDIELVNDETLWILHDENVTEMRLNETGTATEDLNALEYMLYPNPTTGQFFLSFSDIEERRIELYNLEGTILRSEITRTQKWSADLLPGCYLVRMSGADGEAVEKVVVLDN